jgi:hypothetical protein
MTKADFRSSCFRKISAALTSLVGLPHRILSGNAPAIAFPEKTVLKQQVKDAIDSKLHLLSFLLIFFGFILYFIDLRNSKVGDQEIS